MKGMRRMCNTGDFVSHNRFMYSDAQIAAKDAGKFSDKTYRGLDLLNKLNPELAKANRLLLGV